MNTKKQLTAGQVNFLNSRKLCMLQLNHTYELRSYNWQKIIATVKLIKVTPKGFNLLNVETGKCFRYPHMYPLTKDKTFKGYDEPMKFFVHNDWNFIEIEDETSTKLKSS